MPPVKKQAQPEADEETRIRFDGRDYKLPQLDDLTYAEIELIEDAFDKPLHEIDTRRVKFQRWMIYLALKRGKAKVDGEPVTFQNLGEIKFTDVDGDDKDAEGPTEPTAPADE